MDIRTPWTLKSDAIWHKTYHLGGRLMVVGSLLSTVLAILVPIPYPVGVVLGVSLFALFISVS